jgi:palmitoyl-protein thioesterase
MLLHIIMTIACFLTVLITDIVRANPTPVVLVHGIMADEHDMSVLEGYIKEALPGVYVHSVNIGAGKWTSFWSLHRQARWLCDEIQSDPKLIGGFNMICHSQGGLLGRYYLERWNNPKVKCYISIASPQRGVFGLPGTLDNRWKILNHFENLSRYLLYRSLIQNHFSVAQLWNDSYHKEQYLTHNNFLPYLNNEIDHEFAAHYRANICSLDNMVLVGSVSDEIVEPLESAHFGYYKEGSKEEYEKYFEWDVYKSDKLGLKELDDTGRLHIRFSNEGHCSAPEDKMSFEKNILPFLKEKSKGFFVLEDYVSEQEYWEGL